MLKVLHTADWHPKAEDLPEFIKVSSQMVERATEEQPDLIVIPGDLTDSSALRLESPVSRAVIETVKALSDLAPVVICMGTPSHDGDAPLLYPFIAGFYPVWVSTRPEQIALLKDHTFLPLALAMPENTQAVISQIPHIPKQYAASHENIEAAENRLAQEIAGVFAAFGDTAEPFRVKGVPHILTGHWQVGGAMVSETQMLCGRDIEVDRDHIALADADVICLGHIHKQQRLGENIFYCGSLKCNTTGETDPKGFYLHFLQQDADGRSTLAASEFCTVDARRLLALKLDTTQEHFDLAVELAKQLPSDLEGCHVKVLATAFEDAAGLFDRENLKAMLLLARAEAVDIRVTRQPREQVRCAAVLTRKTLRDKVEAMAQLRNEPMDTSLLFRAEVLGGFPEEKVLDSVRQYLDIKNGEAA